MDVDLVKIIAKELVRLAKKRRLKILPPGVAPSPGWLNERSFFRMSAIRTEGMVLWLNTLQEDSSLSVQERIEYLLKGKDDFKKLLRDPDVSDLLKRTFHVDGAIKLSEDEVASLASLPYGVDLSNQGVREKIERILSLCAYPLGRHYVFRGPSYYFMFEGAHVDMKGPLTSINDYEVRELNYDQFARNLLTHYNEVGDALHFATRHLQHEVLTKFSSVRDALCRELLSKLSQKKLSAIRKKATHSNRLLGHQDTDQFFGHQLDQILDSLEEFREMVASYRKTGGGLDQIIIFVAHGSSTLRQAKLVLGVDVDSVLNRHLKLVQSKPFRKLLLGLLDSKINVLAFHQNASQILYNRDFLNPESQGSLVLNRDTVRNMESVCLKEFREFSNAQENARNKEGNLSLLAELEDTVALYMDVLINDNDASYVRLAGLLSPEVWSLRSSPYGACPKILYDSITLMGKFFNFLDLYHKTFELEQQRKQAKSQAREKSFRKSNIHDVAQKNARAKLIRLYREENDPLTMVLTAQQAMNVIVHKGFDPERDVLHAMSINYGGALVGMYAKHTFSRMVPGGQLSVNTGALIYSIYDLKTKGSFFDLSDYPYSSIANDMTLGHFARKKLKSENWLLVFDDNTNSGETVDNVRRLALDSDLFGRIDTFTCRANPNIEKYKESLTPKQRIDIVGVAGLRLRKAKAAGANERYKELIGTIVGNRLFKIVNAQKPPQ
ncbi:hypothetical protein PS858_01132 [Pseudomonas fluorescens]|uniref:hypothetical protein n=1 Tax=Pseudomonas fluorescens TaxID=294 RepID=UPI00123FF317|nr:hypothetical protein [Pseudomonas fluorescens]VVO67830.1 hypothetical protein PS858_01132 [Pseudomonas fluorescens]